MIVVDSREAYQHPNIVKGLGSLAKVQILAYGDYAFRPKQQLIRLEHKTWQGLMADLHTNRVTEQLRQMVENCDIPYLLLSDWRSIDHEGCIVVRGRTYGQVWDYIENYLAEIQEAGVRLRFSPNLAYLANTIINLYEFWAKDNHKALRQVKVEDFKPYPVQAAILAQFPSYGLQIAHQAIRHFGSLGAYLKASAKERQEARDIGKHKAEVVDNILEEEVK